MRERERERRGQRKSNIKRVGRDLKSVDGLGTIAQYLAGLRMTFGLADDDELRLVGLPLIANANGAQQPLSTAVSRRVDSGWSFTARRCGPK